MTRIKWQPLLSHAVEIVGGYDTSVTLRQLFYRLVADGSLPNTKNYYKSLSSYTAKGRREGSFPDLLDRTSRIEEPVHFKDAEDAHEYIRDVFRLDRQAGQPWLIWLGVEKDGISEQLNSWFTEPLGIPHIAPGGFASQTLCDLVQRRVEYAERKEDRPSVLIYAGDHDPSGEDIDRDLQERVGFDRVLRIALNEDQLAQFNIPVNVLDPEVEKKLNKDSRAAQFRARHGYLAQYEVDALDPAVLRQLYQDAIAQFLDTSKFDAVMERERIELEDL